uniref:Vacuolar-sorting protein SNF8 n=1 Tax=Ciona intestinalis TaxID=7719 RepID=F6ZGT8_CIOIN|nr:vacuolar-sorting protein SNF8 [Ciona intestinalis]|eukprot:XP_002125395.1 vacuolar-sorting protein SNF8 [Ciona intestinalis]
MRRRGVGASAITKKKLEAVRYKEHGNELAMIQLDQLSGQLETFHSHLEKFAANHKQEIRKNPQFRRQFQQMCATIGVDPLASGKGFWSEMLGVGDFYYELGVQLVEICITTRPQNGGIIAITELHQKLMKTRGKYAQDVSIDDVRTALSKLKLLGTGFTLLGTGLKQIVKSVPGELNMDHSAILELAQKSNGKVSHADVKSVYNWQPERVQDVLEHLTKEGMAWVDTQTPNKETWYWFPALFGVGNNK